MKAHELLSDESKWQKGCVASLPDGTPCGADNPEASCFCLIGAIQHAYPFEDRQPIYERLDDALGAGSDGLFASRWNDAFERTFAEVKDLLVKLDI